MGFWGCSLVALFSCEDSRAIKNFLPPQLPSSHNPLPDDFNLGCGRIFFS